MFGKNNVIKFIFTIQLFHVIVCQGQNTFIKQYNKTGNDKFTTIQFSDSGYVVGGSSLSTFNNTTTANLLLIDETGNIKNAVEINSTKGDEIRKLIITKENQIVCAGYSNINGGNNDFFIAKFDLSLNKIWIKYFGGSNDDWPFDLIETKDSGIVTVGLSDYSNSTCNTSIIKVDKNGNQVWQNNLGTNYIEWGNTLCELSNGNILVAGWGNTANQLTDMDNLLLLLDAQGNLLQTKMFYTAYDEGIYHLAELPNKNILCSGGNHVAFGNQENCFLIEIDSNLNSQSAFQYQLPNTNTRALQTVIKNDSTYCTLVKLNAPGTADKCITNSTNTGNINWAYMYPTKTQAYFGGISLSNDAIISVGSHIDSLSNQYSANMLSVDSNGNLPNGCYQQTLAFVQLPYFFDSTSFSLNQLPPLAFDSVSLSINSDTFSTTNFCTPSLLPICNIAASDSVFCDKQAIDFYDLSTNNPTQWLWFFSGASPSISTMQNPVNIYYASPGSFDVILIACNSLGCDTLIMPLFITELPQPPIPVVLASGDTLLCSNATAYQWYNVNNTNVVLGTDSFYVPSVAGNYYCLITDTAGCQSPSNVVGITTNLNQQNLMHLKYPSIIYDLTNGTLVINNNDKQVTLSISNYMGQCLMKKQLAIGKTVIGVNEWSSGPYVVKFETQEGIGVFNFVK